MYVSVPGEPASKANSRKAVTIGGTSRFIKSDKALALTQAWEWTCPKVSPLITDDVTAYFWLTYASRRSDLDESLIMDLIQGKLIANDRQIKIKHVYWALDKAKAGAEVLIRRTDCDIDCGGDGCLMSGL